MDKVVSLRLDHTTKQTLDDARGDLAYSVAIRKILEWLQPHGVEYLKDVLGTRDIIASPQGNLGQSP